MNLEKQLDDIRVGEIAPTKFSIDLLAETIAEQVREGHINAVNVAIRLNAMEQLVKSAKEKIAEDVLSELGKYPKGKAEINGVQIAEMSSIKYDFAHIEGWSELDAQINELKAKQKEIEDFQKTYYKGDLPVKQSTVTFKIQIPK